MLSSRFPVLQRCANPTRWFGRLAGRLLALLAGLLLVAALAPTAQAAAPKTPAVPSGLPTGIESLAAYLPELSCDPVAKPGTITLAKLLTATYPGTSYGTGRTCGTAPTSEHYDGRAVDWMNSIRNPTQAAQATAVLNWLLATDQAGNPYANARRLGVMYIIWDGKIWGAYSPSRGWRDYNGCSAHTDRSYDTSCHRDHIHISLTWEGAMGVTSFWSKQVAVRNYGSCRGQGMVWAPTYKTPRTSPCPSYPKPVAPAGASAAYKTLLGYSGQSLHTGVSGSAVKAVQAALGLKADGVFGASTKSAVMTWQSRHGVRASGWVGDATWRTVLAAESPKA